MKLYAAEFVILRQLNPKGNPKISKNSRALLTAEEECKLSDRLNASYVQPIRSRALCETPSVHCSNSDGDEVECYLISTLKADFCCLAPGLHCINEDAKTFFLTSQKAEGQRRVPGRLGQSYQPRLGFSSACYV